MQTMLKDEADAIVEWIEYHALLGVEHFYVYDNNRWAHQGRGPHNLPPLAWHVRRRRAQTSACIGIVPRA